MDDGPTRARNAAVIDRVETALGRVFGDDNLSGGLIRLFMTAVSVTMNCEISPADASHGPVNRRTGTSIYVGRGATTPGSFMTLASADAAARSPDASTLNAWILAVGAHRDRVAFARLFSHFAPRVKAYLMRLGSDAAEAEEVAQDVMVTLWRRSETFDPGQANASTWVFTIARNRRIDLLRRERRPALDPDDPALVPEGEAQADTSVIAAQSADRVRDAIARLPDGQRSLLMMAYYDDLAHSAIAERTDIPLGTVKSRLRLAVARLRKELKDL